MNAINWKGAGWYSPIQEADNRTVWYFVSGEPRYASKDKIKLISEVQDVNLGTPRYLEIPLIKNNELPLDHIKFISEYYGFDIYHNKIEGYLEIRDENFYWSSDQSYEKFLDELKRYFTLKGEDTFSFEKTD